MISWLAMYNHVLAMDSKGNFCLTRTWRHNGLLPVNIRSTDPGGQAVPIQPSREEYVQETLSNLLVYGKTYRKIPYFMGKSMVSCRIWEAIWSNWEISWHKKCAAGLWWLVMDDKFTNQMFTRPVHWACRLTCLVGIASPPPYESVFGCARLVTLCGRNANFDIPCSKVFLLIQ